MKRFAPIEKYSLVVFDNRGVGNSDTPRGPYSYVHSSTSGYETVRYLNAVYLLRRLVFSTSAMAEDVTTLLDYLGWKQERQLHIVGISLGGMISLGMPFPSFTLQIVPGVSCHFLSSPYRLLERLIYTPITELYQYAPFDDLRLFISRTRECNTTAYCFPQSNSNHCGQHAEAFRQLCSCTSPDITQPWNPYKLVANSVFPGFS